MRILEYFQRLSKQNQEILWANIWRDTIQDIKWLQNVPGLSPGRWAVGYNYLYVMTRILNETNPQKILDIGLGVSSKLISQYFMYSASIDNQHIILEHDSSWAEFCSNNATLSDVSKICLQKLVTKKIGNCEYPAYENIANDVLGMKFDVISIDAPFGGSEYSRRDILEVLPDILNDSFIIVIDDVDRKGEKKTVKEIEEVLKNNNIQYAINIYDGMTECCVIASIDNKFVCSL